jgi:phage shock protein C
MSGTLYRHPTDKVIGGVAAGVGAWMGIDPTIVRFAFVLLAIFTTGAFLLLYVLLLFIVPLPPAGWMPPGNRPLTGWGRPGAQPGAQSGAQPGGWQAPPGGGWSPESVTGGNAGIIAGVILIALGAWFLIDRYVSIDWSLLWPVILMVGGIGIIVAVSRRAGPPG